MLRTAVFISLLCLAAGVSTAQGSAPQELDTAAGDVRFELTGPPGPVYVGQTFELTARIVLPPGFRSEHLVPLFRQELELSVQVALPFAEGLPCAAVPDTLAAGTLPSGGPRLVINETVTRAVQPPGQPNTFALPQRFRATCPGELRFSGASLRYAAASGFRDDLFAGRVPLDPEEYTLVSEDFAVDCLALPEAGRPPSFSGAVGALTVAASVEPRDITLGESLQLTLEVRGEGALDGFSPPEFDAPGLHCLGTRTDVSAGARRVVYDLRPTSTDVRSVPAVAVGYFDPETGYRTLLTDPVTVLVRPASAAPSSSVAGLGSKAPQALPEAGAGASSTPPPRSPLLNIAGAVLALAATGWLVRALLVRRGAAVPASAERLKLTADLERGEDPAEALAEYLGQRLGLSRNAVLDGRVGAKLAAAGHPQALAERVERLLEELSVARFGGTAPPDGADRVRVLADLLEAP